MLRNYLPPLVLSFFLLFSASAQQPVDRIKKSVGEKWGVSVTSVTPTPYLGLYEVVLEGRNILYTDEKTSVFLLGNLIDTSTRTNITEARLEELSRIKFSDLPLKQAIKQVRGNGKRILATFEDPNCGYCKRLHQNLFKLSNITIYTFVYPILNNDSMTKSKRIWCAKDQVKAWNDWMIHGKAPSGSESCDTQSVLVQNQAYGRNLRINGTPTLFFADGTRVSGAIPVDEIEKKMDSLLSK